MTRGTGERLYRACQRCRGRKSKCDLNSVGELGRPPCLECFRTGHGCVLAGSRRGGDYTHLRKLRSGNEHSADTSATTKTPSIDRRAIVNSVNGSIDCSEVKAPICAELKNPLDALQILAKAAVKDSETFNESIHIHENPVREYYCAPANNNAVSGRLQGFAVDSSQNGYSVPGIKEYELIMTGALHIETILKLLQHYLTNYHPFVPLAPKAILLPHNIDEMASKEPFLLTAILTIASKDDPNLDDVHQKCWEYMKHLLLDVLLGHPSTQQVGSVEGLLLLSDWVPYIQFDKPTNTGISRGRIAVTEDSTAWSLVGQAVRQAYLLKLDRTSFREETLGESKEQADRKRLVWTFVYLSDRQMSVRMGQSFWSRGPSLSTRFTASDFPTLQPGSEAEDDYASVLQATIEITQLLHNVHEILYSSKARTLEMMRMGDYSRYLDDFLGALSAWYQIWGGLKVSPKLKCTLNLMYEYVCLYVNAFSFQSILSRGSDSPSTVSTSASTHRSQNPSFFPRGVMASPDGRFIFEAIRAAKMGLKVLTDADAASVLRYIPSRFILYGIYSAVFLNRADTFGALTVKKEHNEIIKLVKKFISALEVAATDENHIGLRYSRLLKSLRFRGIDQDRGAELTQQLVSQVALRNSPSNDQISTRAMQDFMEPDITGVLYNGIESLAPTWVDAANFDPFCGSFSYFESDVFGMVPQKDIEFGMLRDKV